MAARSSAGCTVWFSISRCLDCGGVPYCNFGAVALLLLLVVALLCAYELCAVYVTAGAHASQQYSPSGFFFGVSAIALAINMLFICRMVFNGNGLDVDEYVRRAYKFSYSDCIEIGPVACLPEPPDPNELFPRQTSSAINKLLNIGNQPKSEQDSGPGFTSRPSVPWITHSSPCLLGAIWFHSEGITLAWRHYISCCWNIGACLYGFKLLQNRVLALFVAGASRLFLICFGIHNWYLGHCISYIFVASVLSGAVVSRHLLITDPSAARRDALQSTVIRLREGFRRKEQNGSSSSSDGCGSSIKRSGSIDAGHAGCTNETNRTTDNLTRTGSSQEGINSDKSVESGRPSLGSCRSVVQEPEAGTSYDQNSNMVACSSSGLESQGYESSTSNSANQQILDLNLALAFQEQLNGPRIASMLKKKAKEGDLELTNLLQNKGLDPDFAVMLKEKKLDPSILALLQRSSLDADRDHRDNTDITIIDSNSVDNALPNQISLSEELRLRGPRKFKFGFYVLLLSPVICSIMAFLRSLQVEEMALTSKSRKVWLVSLVWLCCLTAEHISWIIAFFLEVLGIVFFLNCKSSVLLGISLTMPLMVACFSVAVPIWMHNGYQFWFPQLCGDQARDPRFPRMKGFILWICLVVFAGSVMALGAIISSKPLDNLKYKLFSAKGNNFMSPYTSSVYLGWAMASGIALVVTAILPIVSWFATYRFSHSSAISLVIFSVVLVAFCGTSNLEVVKSRDDRLPTKGDFLAALLPLACIPALLSLCCGMSKWKDDCWILSRGVYVFVSIGLVLLFGAIAAVIIVIRPWTIGVSFLLVLLLIVVAIGVIQLWASNNFYLTRKQTSFACFLAFLLGMAAFLVGWFQDKAFAGASVGYFTFLFLLAGRALAVLLSPPIVVYSPRVLPVYVYDAHADCGKNVSAAFLVLYGIALATEGWGVVASLIVYPPFAGAAVSAITLVVSFGFAVSRPCLTLEMMEVAVRFLSKDTVVQAISRSVTKTRNALSGSYSAPQRSASSAALLVEDPSAMRDKAGNFVLPRDDVMKLRDRLKNEERVAGSFFYRMQCRERLRHDPPTNVDYRRDMCAHAKVLALEEAIDTEWVYMWDKFGGYLLLLLGLTAKAERVQDEVRLRLFLDSIGFSDLSARKISKWKPEDRRHFEIIQESYLREKEMEEEILMQRREEEGRGKERRKALLEKEERKWKEIEASLIPSIPNAGSREASAMAAAIRAVGGDSVLEDSFARERVCGIARRIRTAQLDRRAQLTGIAGAVCVLDDEPMISGKHCGQMDASLCQSQKISFSITVMIHPDSGPVCLFGTEYQKQVCWEILVAGSEQGIEAGLVGLRLITKGEKQTTVAREWYIGATSITDGRWHTVTITIDADAGEATCYLDGGFDGYQTGLPLSIGSAIWEQGAQVWLGVRPTIDVDAFGRSDSDGVESKMHIMDVFLWGKCLTEDEAASLHAAIGIADLDMIDLADDNWQWTDSPPRVDGWDSDPADVDLYDRDDVDWDGQYSSGRKRRSGRDFLLSVDSFARRYRKPRMETQEEINQRMRSVVSEWMRPDSIVKENGNDPPLCLFSGAANPSDVYQGRLGDCWFLSAVAVLTEVSQISEVIITPEYNEEGIYTVRFCIQGEWVPVVIDDWIPCESPGKPAFATSKRLNELWVSIVEKAYAKLHDYVNSREISCEMVLDPDPKGYTIVPTTIHSGEEAPFVLSVFTKASVVLEALNQTAHFSMVKTCLPAQRNNRG
ncbi:hypothetical protein DY000_02010624, partial [Brassica cretica]